MPVFLFITQINLVFSFLAVLFSFLPLCIYLKKGLAPDMTYLLISLLWAINGLTTLPQLFHWDWYTAYRIKIILWTNLFDDPFILLIFYFTFRRNVYLYLLLAFIIFDSLVIGFMGLNFDSNNIIVNVGGILALILNIWGISRYFRIVNHTSKDNVMVYVYTGFVFYYALFFEITYLYKYLRSTYSPLPYDSFSPYGMFICYLAIFLSTMLISFGFWKYATNGKKELSALNLSGRKPA